MNEKMYLKFNGNIAEEIYIKDNTMCHYWIDYNSKFAEETDGEGYCIKSNIKYFNSNKEKKTYITLIKKLGFVLNKN